MPKPLGGSPRAGRALGSAELEGDHLGGAKFRGELIVRPFRRLYGRR